VVDLPVYQRTLANGLKALILPRPTAPTVVCDLFYPVGSVDEPPGQSGISHFVEHMLFKGTSRFPKGQIDRLAFVAAGHANAETGEDDTHYWFSFPADRWELALAVEADRMRGALFDPAEIEAERHVIAEERARDLDSPLGRLDQAHRAVSYLIHPYRNPILGWPEDLRRLTGDDLRRFYQTYYRPEGAVLVVVGAVEPSKGMDRIESYFGDLTRGERPRPAPPPGEPPQCGRRDVRLEGPDSLCRGLLGWRSVGLGHPDGPILDVLSDLLTCGRRSRLWSRLVDGERLATWVDAGQESSRSGGQFTVQLELVPGVEPERVEMLLREELSRLADEGPTEEELARSQARLEAAWRWEQEDLTGLSTGLGRAALWEDWRAWQDEHRAALAVSAADIGRVASLYLVDRGLTAAWSLPRGEATLVPVDLPPLPIRPAAPPAPDLPLPLVVPSAPASLDDYHPRRTVLPNGLRVTTERRPGTGTVALELHLHSGQVREAKPGLAHLVGRLREEGTRSRSADQLAEAIEDVGGTLDVGATGVSLRVRREDLALAMELLADVTLYPAYPAEAFPWTRRRILAELQADRDDPAFRADRLFHTLIYGDHPFARDPRGSARQLAALTIDDVWAHHQALTFPNNAILVVVGDYDPRRLQSLVQAHLGHWRPGLVVSPRVPRPARGIRPRLRRVPAPGEQVQIRIGHLGIRRDNPDFDALCVLDHILGSGPGFTDRLSRVLRDELGLVYTVGGGITDSADLEPGLFRIDLATGPDEANRATEAVCDQIQAMHLGAFRDEEVDAAARYLASAWVFDYQTVGQRAERLLELELWGLPLDDPLRRPDRIRRITPRDVRRAARRWIDPSALVRVEYGPIRRRVSKAGRECA
jgi:zinc protease